MELFLFVIVCLHTSITKPIHNNTDSVGFAIHKPLHCSNCGQSIQISQSPISMLCIACTIQKHQAKVDQHTPTAIYGCALLPLVVWTLLTGMAAVMLQDKKKDLPGVIYTGGSFLTSLGLTYTVGNSYIQHKHKAEKHSAKVTELKKLIETT
jgi:hypothetical protein